MTKCSEVMTSRPVSCMPEDVVARAAKLMKVGNIGSIPVIQDEKSMKLVGIVTDRDLAMHIVAEGRDPKSTKVGAVMTGDVVTCMADDDLQMALDAMGSHQLRRIPVIDSAAKLVGIIAQADVATRVNQPTKTAEVVKEISQAKPK
ncbi:MAG TPA: CBS domain-containing protein [Anaerolineales bacterium]|nr:CBS domain-containing protein [Anaerolineales bacterium]